MTTDQSREAFEAWPVWKEWTTGKSDFKPDSLDCFEAGWQAARQAEREEMLVWNRVEDGLPTVAGDYFVIREHSELHTIAIASAVFNPRAVPIWYDRGFDYLYWIGPILRPEELELTLQGELIRYKIRKRKTPFALKAPAAKEKP